MKHRPARFQPGVSSLPAILSSRFRGCRVAVVSHAAAVDTSGTATAEVLARCSSVRLKAMFGPEHGFFGNATAGEKVPRVTHPEWSIPVFSLYGKHRAPDAASLRNIDAIVIDLQDLAIRCYTFCSTIRLVLESASKNRIPVIVADRPVPFPTRPDGPLLDPAFESFIGMIPSPLVYAMTPGETALWLSRRLNLDLNLSVARMPHYRRQHDWRGHWPWISPSPGIRSWESAVTYPATVFLEALPAFDFGRGTIFPFQVVGAPRLRTDSILRLLARHSLPGTAFRSQPYVPGTGPHANRLVRGLRLVVTDPARFRPVETAVTILHCLQAVHGHDELWRTPGTRIRHFDLLAGTDALRKALQEGTSPREIARSWTPGIREFERTRRPSLLYPSA